MKELIIVTGPSGAGKSTFLQALSGLATRATGRVRWGDADVGQMTERAKARFRRAVELDWYNPWAHWCLANVQLGRGNRELVELLIRHGAIVDTETPEGHTAIDYAAAAGHADIVRRLVGQELATRQN